MSGLFSTIASIKDEKVLEARSLGSFHGRAHTGKFLCEGELAIKWALESPCQLCYSFVHDKQKEHPFVQLLIKEKVPVYLVSDGILKKITDTSYLIPFVAVAEKRAQEELPSGELLVVLDGVQDLGNMGTIVRTASAFGIREFFSTSQEGDFFYAKTVDASRGMVFHSKLYHGLTPQKSLEELKALGYQIVVTTPHASLMQSLAPLQKKKMALVFGNETHGASQEMLHAADVRIQIPMSGEVESLNVAVAAGISLYEMKIQWILHMLKEKIQSSVGRSLSLTSRYLRAIFSEQLALSCKLHAEQAIIMMMLQCELEGATKSSLYRDSGAREPMEALINPLLENQWLVESAEGHLSITDKGSELLAKIWIIHEKAESSIFEGVSENDRATFLRVLEAMQLNGEKASHLHG